LNRSCEGNLDWEGIGEKGDRPDLMIEGIKGDRDKSNLQENG